MRIALTLLILTVGLIARQHMPENTARFDAVPYEAQIVPVLFKIKTADVAVCPSCTDA